MYSHFQGFSCFYLYVVKLMSIKSMKTEYEKMRSQELYYFSDPEIHASLVHAKKVCACLRSMTIYDEDYRQVIEELIPGIPQSTTICPPFHCDHGTGIILGENVFMNYDCIMLDGGYIRIGKHTLIGPHCQFYTPQHPMDYVERREEKETAYPITSIPWIMWSAVKKRKPPIPLR